MWRLCGNLLFWWRWPALFCLALASITMFSVGLSRLLWFRSPLLFMCVWGQLGPKLCFLDFPVIAHGVAMLEHLPGYIPLETDHHQCTVCKHNLGHEFNRFPFDNQTAAAQQQVWGRAPGAFLFCDPQAAVLRMVMPRSRAQRPLPVLSSYRCNAARCVCSSSYMTRSKPKPSSPWPDILVASRTR